jgi:hypothetical protein
MIMRIFSFSTPGIFSIALPGQLPHLKSAAAPRLCAFKKTSKIFLCAKGFRRRSH